MKQHEIPEFLTHLPVHKGMPVPYFVTLVDGIPDFRLLDARKQELCLTRNLCAVCGFPLGEDRSGYVICGPLGLMNRVSTDPTMHRECADYSLHACPHLSVEKAERRHTNLPEGVGSSAGSILAKPKILYLVKCIPTAFFQLQHVFRFTLLDWEEYIYTNGKLTFNRMLYEECENHEASETAKAIHVTGRAGSRPVNWPAVPQPKSG